MEALAEKPTQTPAHLSVTCDVCGSPSTTPETKTYTLKNLGCPNCAAKMEAQIQNLDTVSAAQVAFPTQTLTVTGVHPDCHKQQFQDICQSIESEVEVVEKARSVAKAELEEEEEESSLSDIIAIAIGVVVLAIGLIAEHILHYEGWLLIVIFLVGYIAAGGEVLIHAAKNIRKGQVFDENFLMSIATFGAIAVGEFPEAVGVMVFYRIGDFFEDRAVARSRSQIMDALDLRPEVIERVQISPDALTSQDAHTLAERLHQATTLTLPADEAQVGDIVMVRAGDRIPLDGVVIAGESLIDTSPITGEPVPVQVRADAEVLSGCVNQTGVLYLRVTHALEESLVSRILDSVEHAQANKPQIEKFITRFAAVYTPIVIAIAVLTALIPSLITGDWQHWFYTACTFLVISCPCAIVLSVPLSYFAGIGAASRLGILFKGGSAIEALRQVRAVVLDKTGTLTRGSFEVVGVDRAPKTSLSEEVLVAAASAIEAKSTHPIARSISAYAVQQSQQTAEDFVATEITEHAGAGMTGVVHHAGETLNVAVGNARMMDEVGAEGYKSEAADGADDAARAAETVVYVAINGVYAGAIRIADVLKDDAREALARIKSAGIHTAMLTGDALTPAHAVGALVGVDEVHAELLPHQKLETMDEVRTRQGAVMFVGDGINDAPVLAGADVGAAMGSGSDAAIEAADVVFMQSNVSAISQALNVARRVGAIAMENVVFAIGVKVLVMVCGFVGLASMWAAVFADVGVALLCILNSIRILSMKF